jgi:uncharacterized protein YndB with AHSA1/START domain
MYDILHRVGIDAKPERVFTALTTIEDLRAWWITGTDGDPTQDGVINFGFCDMEVIAAEPGQLVRWRCIRGPEEWLNTEVIFQLEWKQNQTFVLFKHAKWQEPVEFTHHCSTKWATFLLSLRDLIEKGKGRPVPDDLRIEVNERM